MRTRISGSITRIVLGGASLGLGSSTGMSGERQQRERVLGAFNGERRAIGSAEGRTDVRIAAKDGDKARQAEIYEGGKAMRLEDKVALVLERRLGCRLAPGKPGPKPRAHGDTGREPPLL